MEFRDIAPCPSWRGMVSVTSAPVPEDLPSGSEIERGTLAAIDSRPWPFAGELPLRIAPNYIAE